MAYRILLVIAFVAGAHTQAFGRSFDVSFGSRGQVEGAAFRAPNSNSFSPPSPRLSHTSQPVTFNAVPSPQGQFFSTSGSTNVNRIRRTRVPPSQSFGINFQSRPVAKEPFFVSFGAPGANPTISFSNKDEKSNPRGTSTPISLSNKNRASIGAPITFSNSGGRPLPPPGPFISSPRVPALETPSKLPGNAPSRFAVTSIPKNQPQADNTSPIVFFPPKPFAPSQNRRKNENVGDNGNCPLEYGLIFFDGNCSRLLSRSSCGSDQWLVLSDQGVPHCTDRACPWQKLEFQGDCVDPANPEVCPRGQILYIDFNGQAECDCEVDHYYDPDSGHCYTYHEQGPCQSSFYLEQQQGGGVRCVPNPCDQDDRVLVEGKCYVKNYKGFCRPELVMILPKDNSADCSFIVPHSIFDVPTLNACAGGSRRDFLGMCRAVFRVPSQTSLPSLRGECPTEFVSDPSGTCRKVVRLFG
ncbi:protein of unknown function DUF4789 [Trinorchestia longiramus]|nr:protein of unknown function DUF4789 [Trinorchestia longiramus]